MQTKPLLYGIVGFILGGLLVSIAATTFDKPKSDMQQMATSLQGKKADDYDKAFVADMIEHHQAAVDMAKLSAKNAKHKEIKQLSQNIITAQEKEIAQMKQWQKQWGYTDASMNMSTSH
jgi:uncharacterized protein (DUF305 family)